MIGNIDIDFRCHKVDFTTLLHRQALGEYVRAKREVMESLQAVSENVQKSDYYDANDQEGKVNEDVDDASAQ